MSKFYETNSEARWWAGITGRIVLAVVIIGLLAAAFFGVKVFTSDTRGRGDQIVRNNSEVNRTGKQEMFEDLYADIEGYRVQIKTTAAQPITPGDEARMNTVLTGLLNQCTSVVQQFNAESRKVTSEDWKSIDLPQELDAGSLCVRPTTTTTIGAPS